MDLEKGKTGDYTIKLGKGETPKNALRSIAVASFELSRAAGMGIFHFDGGSTLKPEQADRYIKEKDGKFQLDMDYVEGRQVKTHVNTDEQGQLIFNSWLFERDRGNPTPMFSRAQEILNNIETAVALPVEVTSTKSQFQKDSLDSRMQELGYARNPGEDDEKLRSRVFPDLFRRDKILAGEFLLGKHVPEWTETERLEYMNLLQRNPSIEDLMTFAQRHK